MKEHFLAVRWRGSREIKDKTKSIKASSHEGLMSRWFFSCCFWISEGFFTGLSWSTVVIIIRHISHSVPSLYRIPLEQDYVTEMSSFTGPLTGQPCKPGDLSSLWPKAQRQCDLKNMTKCEELLTGLCQNFNTSKPQRHCLPLIVTFPHNPI